MAQPQSKDRAYRRVYEAKRRADLKARGRCLVCGFHKEPARRNAVYCETCALRAVEKRSEYSKRATEAYSLARRIAKGEPFTLEQIVAEAKRIVALYRDERREPRRHLDIDELAVQRIAQ